MARQTDGEGRTDIGTNCPTDRDGQKQDRTSGWTYITHVPASLNEDLQTTVSLSTRVFVRFRQREGVAGNARGGVAGRARGGGRECKGVVVIGREGRKSTVNRHRRLHSIRRLLRVSESAPYTPDLRHIIRKILIRPHWQPTE